MKETLRELGDEVCEELAVPPSPPEEVSVLLQTLLGYSKETASEALN